MASQNLQSLHPHHTKEENIDWANCKCSVGLANCKCPVIADLTRPNLDSIIEGDGGGIGGQPSNSLKRSRILGRKGLADASNVPLPFWHPTTPALVPGFGNKIEAAAGDNLDNHALDYNDEAGDFVVDRPVPNSDFRCVHSESSAPAHVRSLSPVLYNPPMIHPFAVPHVLQGGGRLPLDPLTCSVSKGNKLIRISWSKPLLPPLSTSTSSSLPLPPTRKSVQIDR